MYEINVKNYARWNFHLKNGNFFRLIKTFLECCTRTFVFEWQTLKSAKWRLFHIFFTSIGLVICHSHNYYYIRRHDHQHIIMIIIQCLANVNYILLYLHTSLIFFFQYILVASLYFCRLMSLENWETTMLLIWLKACIDLAYINGFKNF